MKNIFLSLICLFILLPFFSYSAQFEIDRVNIKNGLSDNYILSIAQDHHGSVWIGTESGLNRFDGSGFTKFTTETFTNKTNICDNGINKILPDSINNVIWIATKKGGISKYDIIKGEFTNIDIYQSSQNTTVVNGITDLHLSGNNKLWVATYNRGLKLYDINSGDIEHINLRSSTSLPKDYRIKCINEHKNGDLYIGHWGNGLSILSKDRKHIKHYEFNADSETGLPGNEILSICFDSFDNIWLGTHRGLVLFNPENEEFKVIKSNKNNPSGLSNDDIHSIIEIDKSLWIGTWKDGINILDLKSVNKEEVEKNVFTHIKESNLNSGLSSPSIVSICNDSFGNIWFGSFGEGLNVIKHTKPYFSTLSFSSIIGDTNSLSDKYINCLTCDKNNNLWIGNRKGGIDLFSKDSFDNLIKEKTFNFNNDVLASLSDSKGNVWFAVDRNGLFMLEKDKKEIDYIKLSSHPIKHSYITSLYEDRNSNIWISTHDGLFRYNHNRKELKELNVREIGIYNDLVNCIVQDGNGNYWIGSSLDGISVVDKDFKLISRYHSGNILPSSAITSLYCDSDKDIWIATTEGALRVEVSPEGDTKTYKINKEIGLYDLHVRAFAEGENNEMWLASTNTISCYNKESQSIKTFDYHNGIKWLIFKNNAVAKSNDGYIFFGSQDGICYFNSKEDPEVQITPKIKITGFAYNDKKESLSSDKIYTSMSTDNNVMLSHNQNTVTIEFNVFDYALKENIEYYYQINSQNNIWYPLNGQNQITLHDLSPGDYIFKVKAKAFNETWSETISYNIIITPPFWKTWYAKLFYILTVIVIIVSFFFFYKRRIDVEKELYIEKQNHDQQLKLNEDRFRFYTNIAHELRTPLTLIIGPLKDLTEQTEIPKEFAKKISIIYKSAIRLSDLINQILEFRKIETNNRTLNVAFGNPSDMIHEIVAKYKELNRNNNLRIDFESNLISSIYFDKEIFTIITDNLISNAIKYTSEGIIKVSLKEETVNNKRLTKLEIKDTGCGIPENELDMIFERYYRTNDKYHKQGSGIGLALSKNLAILHKGDIKVWSSVNYGTTFCFIVETQNQYPEAIHKIIEKKEDIQNQESSLPTLLVVEDNDDIREYIVDTFCDIFNIREASNGKEGVNIARDIMPDAIISDIMMPVMDGNELCRTLKEEIRTSHIPIILLTAKDTEKDKSEGYSSGADSYITKPFSASVLKSRVQNLITNREKIAEYLSSGSYKKSVITNSINKIDSDFLTKLDSLIEINMSSNQVNISFLSSELNMSYSSFTKKMKSLTGITANDYIRKVKMRNAEQMIISGKYNISEIAEKTGYNSMSYFREAFKEEFGVLPSKYVDKLSE